MIDRFLKTPLKYAEYVLRFYGGSEYQEERFPRYKI